MTGVRFPSATKTNSPVAQARVALRGTKKSSAAETTTQPARYTASQTSSPIACIPSESPNTKLTCRRDARGGLALEDKSGTAQNVAGQVQRLVRLVDRGAP